MTNIVSLPAAIFVAVLAAVSPAQASAADSRSPQQLYSDAMRVMQSLPQPSFVETTTELTSSGMGFYLQDVKGWAYVSIGFGSSDFRHDAQWKTYFRSGDAAVAIVTSGGKHLM